MTAASSKAFSRAPAKALQVWTCVRWAALSTSGFGRSEDLIPWALCLASIVVFAVVFIGRESGEAEKEFEETAVGGGTAPTLRVASWNMAVGEAQPKIGYLALNLRAPRPGHQ